MTSNVDFSSSAPPASPPAAGAAAAATATGAAAVTPNFSSKSFNSSLSWITDSSAIPSRISSLVRVAIFLAFLSFFGLLVFGLVGRSELLGGRLFGRCLGFGRVLGRLGCLGCGGLGGL